MTNDGPISFVCLFGLQLLTLNLFTFQEAILMKPMIWHPEEKDAKVNQYLDQMNRAPYGTIFLVGFGLFCLFSLVVLLASF